MTQAYGNLINRILEDAAPPEPKPGMGATELLWSDRHAGTIIDILSPKKILWQRDKATRVEDTDGYTYERDPKAPQYTFTLRKNGRWVMQYDSMSTGISLLIGARDERYDRSF